MWMMASVFLMSCFCHQYRHRRLRSVVVHHSIGSKSFVEKRTKHGFSLFSSNELRLFAAAKWISGKELMVTFKMKIG